MGALWLRALLIGGYASSVLSSDLSMSFDIPGTSSDIADSAIQQPGRLPEPGRLLRQHRQPGPARKSR